MTTRCENNPGCREKAGGGTVGGGVGSASALVELGALHVPIGEAADNRHRGRIQKPSVQTNRCEQECNERRCCDAGPVAVKTARRCQVALASAEPDPGKSSETH